MVSNLHSSIFKLGGIAETFIVHWLVVCHRDGCRLGPGMLEFRTDRRADDGILLLNVNIVFFTSTKAVIF